MSKEIKHKIGEIVFYFNSSLPRITLNKCKIVKKENAAEDKRFKAQKYYLEDLETKEEFSHNEFYCNTYIFSKEKEALEFFKRYVVVGIVKFKDLLNKFPSNSKTEEWKSNLLYLDNLLKTL